MKQGSREMKRAFAKFSSFHWSSVGAEGFQAGKIGCGQLASGTLGADRIYGPAPPPTRRSRYLIAVASNGFCTEPVFISSSVHVVSRI